MSDKLLRMEKDNEEELSAFREEWQRELESTTQPLETAPREESTEHLSDEEKAKHLFLLGVELERNRKLYEAIQHYKRAMQIVPDIEFRLHEASEPRTDSPTVAAEVEEITSKLNNINDDDEDFVEGESLLEKLQRIMARKGTFCEPEILVGGPHISWLPYEVLLILLRWVVSSDLDAVSLERLGETCRGLYVATREPNLWRALCTRVWGIERSTPRAAGFTSWRQMFIERPHLNLHGCYISKTTYLRHGENSFQDQSYRPWYLIDYYRYLRFFPEGVVLMWTTADEPAACVGQLKHRAPKTSLGIMSGHYRLIENKVVVVIKKSGEKKQTQLANTRFRVRRKDIHEQHEQVFHLELEIRNLRSRRNWQLQWRGYSVSTRNDQWTQFELTPNKFPPFAFSRVRNYTAEATAPLLYSHA